MTVHRRELPPRGAAGIDPNAARTQVAALPWRVRDGDVQVLLVTSRETARWVLPKGWPMAGRSGAEAARQEAWEEAGAEGRVSPLCLGFYVYQKVLGPEAGVPCLVAVYPLRVKTLAKRFPERRQRKRRWFSLKKAAARVDEPELADLIRRFTPGALAD
jgi:8-oxo-dGTP pyrophosphatase MutT (NUDIX family)